MTPHLRIVAPCAALALVLVSGCSSPSEDAPPSEGRTVDHAFGQSTITSMDRVAVLDGDRTMEAVVALGVQPVASIKPQLTGAYSEPVAALLDEEPADIGAENSEVDLEALAAAEPDLILMYTEEGEGEDVYEQASQIAPTVAVEYAPAGWQDTLRELGTVLEREQAADDLLSDYTEAAETAAASLDAGGTALSIVRVRTDAVRYMTSEGSFPWSVAAELGYQKPDQQEAGDDVTQTVDVGPEQWEQLAGDEMLLLVDAGAEDAAADLLEDPRLADVGEVTELPSADTLFGSVLSARALLDQLASR